MTVTTTRSRITALALSGILATAACSSTLNSTPEPVVNPAVEATTPAVEATTPAAEPTTGASDVEDAGVVDEPAVVPVGVGETVPADQIEAARAEGASVYVSPNGIGDGVVIEPGITPEALIDDVSLVVGAAPQTLTEFSDAMTELSDAGLAARAANTGVFVLFEAPSYGGDGSLTASQYVVEGFGVIDGVPDGANYIRPTREEAIAAIQPVMDANPGYALIDLVG